MRIHQLPPLIANQIAAGEVIERPASVVKELLENSFDAGASAITIEIGYGGLNQIKISDNGIGIVAEDLPLAIAAHATSKINSLNDLYAISSMGFRGEALASIASVAKLTISSKVAEQATAMQLQVCNGEMTISPCAHKVGTTVDVVDLFFNAPVRKRFLKSEKLEFQAIETVIKRFALSAPSVSLTIKHNGKHVLTLPAANTEQSRLVRMSRILGSVFMKEAIFLDVERGGMRLYGWSSGPGFQRSQNDRQWVYINQRMVKDKLIHHAIKQAYEDILYPGRYPACVLYLTIDTAEVDVNVHPTKHEVRFQQPRLVHDFFTSQLRMALQTKQVTHQEQDYEHEHVGSTAVQIIHEPSPLLSVSTPNYFTADVSWIILNNCFILTFIDQQPYLVNFPSLQTEVLQKQLTELVLPWPSRPLLVPIRYSLIDEPQLKISELGICLRQLGIEIELINDAEILVRTIPLATPNLDLRLLFNAIKTLTEVDIGELIKLIIKAQVFDPRLLSQEEKIEFNSLLHARYRQEKQKKGLFKALTIEDCRDLLSYND